MPNPNDEFLEIDLGVMVGSDDFAIDLDAIVGGDSEVLLSQELMTHYSTCPFCGGEVDLSIIDLFEPDVYFYCSCFAESAEWQARMRSFPIDKFIEPPVVWIQGTYLTNTDQAVIAIMLTPEKIEVDQGIWRWIWKAYLTLDPTDITSNSELKTRSNFLPPTLEAVESILKLQDLNHWRIAELIKRLGNFPSRVDAELTQTLLQKTREFDQFLMGILHSKEPLL